MKDQDFRLADTDSAKQQFAHAALEEFARMGGKDDEVFLEKVLGKLDEIDHETDVSRLKVAGVHRPRRAQSLWISAAAAAVFVLVAVSVTHNLTGKNRPANPPQTIVASVTVNDEVSLEKQTLPNPAAPISEPLSLPEVASVQSMDSKPAGATEKDSEYIFLSRQLSLDDGEFDFGLTKSGKVGQIDGIYHAAAGAGEESKVLPPSEHFDFALKDPAGSRHREKKSSDEELDRSSVTAAGKASILTPYVAYNGTPDTWRADSPSPSNGGIPDANENNVFYGGVRLNVDFGDEPKMPQPLTLSAIHDHPQPLASNTLSAAEPNPEPGHSTNEKIEAKVVSQNEKYGQLIDNPFASPLKDPLSTFSVDVDTASYSNIRRMITAGQMIPSDAVRIEEMINYFSYDYPQPEGEHPFSFAAETAKCPWNPDHQLLRVAIQGKDLQRDARQPANLVFLLDVSGSMNDPNKLPLVKQSMELLIEELTGRDTISIVVYAGSEGLCLPATSGSEKQKILDSLNRLQAGGSTNGGAGIDLAYKMAKENYKAHGINRVVLCTDGDFNVGRVDNGSLVELVGEKAKDGTFLSVLGFGTGNINDSMLEEITNKGNGNYFYIDSIKEGRKVLLEEMMSILVTIAKDVKIQVEFNPKQVQDYRLIGYANRMLKAEDFENDRVDAGEVGVGHSVTALYEIVPVGAPPIQKHSPNLKYQAPIEPDQPKMKLVESHELCTLKLRYKLPKSNVSIPMELAITAKQQEWKAASDDFQFAAAVGLWGMLLREAEHCEKGTTDLVLEMAKEGCGVDPFARRNDFIELVKEWTRLKALGGVSQKDGINANDVFHGGVRVNVGF